MNEEQASRLFELADLILAVGRQIHAAKEFGAESWTPLESAVMRFIDRNPGTSASAAAEATQLISSNFSRALRGLERKGLVRRDEKQRAHIYQAARPQEWTQRQLAGDLLHRAFNGSARSLLLGALSAQKASKEELSELHRLLEEYEKGNR